MKKFSKSFRYRFMDSIFYGIKVKSLFVLAGSLLMLFSLMAALEILSPTGVGQFRKVEMKSKNPAIEKSVNDIASKFICNCGKCSRENLTKCKCQDAIAERNLIRALISKNVLATDIINVINSKYGGLIESKKLK
ncbi:MAG: hypothetical protein HYZ10_11765 [Ignavibacteriales bacterium]|nr:hypothetical protein [Ignavibacteriales bacterium]